MNLNELQRRIINNYQGGFPLLESPYRVMADELGCSEADIIDSLEQLLSSGTLSRFGPLYDAVQLGGGLTLAALCVPEHRYEAVTDLVNAFPQVAHNYRREHELNMWFVVATDTAEQIEETLQAISKATGLKVYDFPKQQEFYIGLWLHLDEHGGVSTRPVPDKQITRGEHRATEALDRAIIRHSQGGLVLQSNPWSAIAADIGCSSQQVLKRVASMQASGMIRRIGAVPNHYRLGLRANGMTVWDVPDEMADSAGQRIGELDFVSHCYLRPRRLPAWPYNLFAMVHGHDRDEVINKTELITELLAGNCRAHEILFSSAILKKTGLRLAA